MSENSGMTLYTYEHCPYCLRARVALGLLGVDYEHVVLLNDDEKTPKDLIGKKMVPILRRADGEVMGESLDIVDYVEDYATKHLQVAPLARPAREAVLQWIERVREYANYLVMPRVVQLDLPEFSTSSARQYFTDKKSALIGDFSENLTNSAEYVARLNEDLQALEPMIGESEGLEVCLLFPVLRNFTVVKGVQWPQAVREYVERVAEKTDIALFFNEAM